MHCLPKILFASVFLISGVFAQSQKITINGYISDAATGERLPVASVQLLSGYEGTSANAYGFYSITLNATEDTVWVRYSFPGYIPLIRKIVFDVNHQINIELIKVTDLDSINIIVFRQKNMVNNPLMSSISMNREYINSLPAFMGEPDVLRSIQLLPGVQSGSEGAGGFYVRGGSIDQNLILLDGVPVYNASHLFGFFSVFNTDAIQNVELMKGSFPARYGGRLSSVVDIRMKEGSNQSVHAEAAVGLLSGKITLEGPIKKNKSSFIISARRTYADLFMRPLIKAITGDDATYFFYDLNAKINVQVSDKDHLYVSAYLGKDRMNTGNIYQDVVNPNTVYIADFYWGNTTGVTRWNHQFSRKLFANFAGYFTQYNFNLYNEQGIPDSLGNTTKYIQNYLSSITDKSVRVDLDFIPSAAHFIKAGAGITWHTFKPGTYQAKINTTTGPVDSANNSSTIQARETDMYAEDDWRISRIIKVNAGVHFSSFNVESKLYNSLQPRLSARLLLNSDMSIKGSYVQMVQYIHLLTNSGIGLPTDLWVPATANVLPQRSEQYALGWEYQPKNIFEFSSEIYYKNIENVIEYAEGTSFINSIHDWQSKVVAGKGTSYGMELLVQKKRGKTTGLLGYTWSKTTRTFDALNNGNTFPYKYDRRNDIKLAVIHQLTRNIKISLDWVYGTGLATTLPTAVYLNNSNREIEVYKSRNNYRLPPFHRLDVSIQFTKVKKHFERTWHVDIYNVYNRLNTFYIYRDTKYDAATRQYQTAFYSASLFPVIPSVSYSIKF